MFTLFHLVLIGTLGGASVPPGALATSPDGAWIAYVQESRGVPAEIEKGWIFRTDAVEPGPRSLQVPPTAFRIWASKAETGESVLLAESRHPVSAPDWKPDGSAIAYVRIAPARHRDFALETVIQESPDSQKVVRSEAIPGPVPSDRVISRMTPRWSSDGRYLAIPSLAPQGLVILSVDRGRTVKTLPGASRPRWPTAGTRLAFVTAGASRGVWVLDGVLAEPRRVAAGSAEDDALPAPIWTRDGQAVIVLRRGTTLPAQGGRRPSTSLHAVTYKADATGVESQATLSHDALGPEGSLLDASFARTPEGDDTFYNTVTEGQLHGQITWARLRLDEVQGKLPLFDESVVPAAPATTSGARWLAFRVGNEGSWSAPIIYDTARQRFRPLCPDEEARRDWLARILSTILPILQDRVPRPVLTDGSEASRPSILPAPAELEVGDPAHLRLKRLASMGLDLLGPVSPETDETRLAFAYLAEDSAESSRVLNRLRSEVDDPARLRDFRLLEAQIALQQKRFDQAETLLEDLQRRSPARYELDELPQGRFLMRKQSDPTTEWVRFLREKAGTLKTPAAREEGEDLVPRNVLDLERLRPQPPEQAPRPNGLPF